MPNHRRGESIPQIRLEQPLPPLPRLPLPVSPVTPSIRIQIPDQIPFERYHDEESDEDSVFEGARRDGLRKPQRNDNHLSPISPSRSPLSLSRESTTPYRDQLSPTSPISRSGISISISRPQSPSIASSNGSQISISVGPSQTASPIEDDQSKPPEYEPMYDYLRSSRRPIHAFTSPNSNTFLSPTSRPDSPVDFGNVDFRPYHDNADHPFVITLSPLSPRSRPPQNPGEPGPPAYEELYLQHPTQQRQDELYDLVRQMDIEGNRAEEICKFVIGMIMLALVVVGVGLAFNWGKGWGPQCPRGAYRC
jgi:hypothetical protein